MKVLCLSWLSLTLIQARALCSWDVGIDSHKKDVLVDRDLGVHYMKMTLETSGRERLKCSDR